MTITPYQKSKLAKKEQIRNMFNNISNGYDSLNRIISLRNDISWRKKVVAMAIASKPKYILDVATGTADLAIAFAKERKLSVVGVDISDKMIDVGNKKIHSEGLQDIIELRIEDAENLSFSDNTFDVVSVSFGVRNFENIDKGLLELKRVLKPQGKLLILETSVPNNPIFKVLYSLYSKALLPLIGFVFSRDKAAYYYLSKSARHFPCGRQFEKILLRLGYKEMKSFPQTLGVATIYSAKK